MSKARVANGAMGLPHRGHNGGSVVSAKKSCTGSERSAWHVSRQLRRLHSRVFHRDDAGRAAGFARDFDDSDTWNAFFSVWGIAGQKRRLLG